MTSSLLPEQVLNFLIVLIDLLLVALSALQVLLHVLDGLIIKLALDLSGFAQVVVIDQEFIEFMDAFLEVVDVDLPVVVEVESHPIVLDDDLRVFVVFVGVLHDLLLVLLDDLEHVADQMVGLVVDHVEFDFERIVHLVHQVLVHYDRSFLHLFEPFIVVHQLICRLVRRRLLQYGQTFLSRVQSDVNQLEA